MENNQTKARVLITGFLPPPFSGMGTYYQSILDSNLKNSVDINFVSTSTQKRSMATSGKATAANFLSAINDCVRFNHALKKSKPQIVHIGTAFGLSFVKHSICVMIALLNKKKVLIHPHCSINALYTGKSKIWQCFFRRIVSRTSGLIALSQEWMQLNEILPEINVYYLPNPVNLRLYNDILKHRFSLDNERDQINVLYLGHLGKDKGSFDIIETAILIRSRDVKILFHLVGSDLSPGEIKCLKEIVRKNDLGEMVKFYAPVFGDEKYSQLEKADLFIYPSYHEGMPMAILEAMASGLPIIASRVGGIPDLVKDELNGILIEPGQPDQLANAICKLALNSDLRKSMQKMSYLIVSEKFNIALHITQLTKIYNDLAINNN